MAVFKIEHVRRQDMHDRAHVEIDGRYTVVIIRTGEGLVIDVVPTGWDWPVDSFSVWDDEVAGMETDTD